ncbi:unnamed protein product [Tilletia caries]|nr:unnamed protein product [Tilletia caries]
MSPTSGLRVGMPSRLALSSITLQHTEIATEGFLQEILDILINTFTATRASSTLALPALPAPDLRSSIRFITHRVVHGAGFPHPYVISHNPSDEDERAAQLLSLERLEALAPLHNIVSTRVIKLCLRVMPNADQLCLWDTAFHWTIPEEISTYPVWQPEAIQLPGGMPLRKWGLWNGRVLDEMGASGTKKDWLTEEASTLFAFVRPSPMSEEEERDVIQKRTGVGSSELDRLFWFVRTYRITSSDPNLNLNKQVSTTRHAPAHPYRNPSGS